MTRRERWGYITGALAIVAFLVAMVTITLAKPQLLALSDSNTIAEASSSDDNLPPVSKPLPETDASSTVPTTTVIVVITPTTTLSSTPKTTSTSPKTTSTTTPTSKTPTTTPKTTTTTPKTPTTTPKTPTSTPPTTPTTPTKPAYNPLTDPPQIGGCQIFPSNDPWNVSIVNYPVSPSSSMYINAINNMGSRTVLHPDFGGAGEYGMPINIINGAPSVPVNFGAFAYDSMPGPYPLPGTTKIQPGSDAHVVLVNTQTCMLYELYHASKNSDGSWNADSGAYWDLTKPESQPYYKTTSNAAGTPILPGVIRYSEVAAGAVNHAIRFTVPTTFSGFILPATHYNDPDHTDPTLPPLGLRVRLKASYDISNFPPESKIILTAMKKYGMILVQNGSAWAFGGEQDTRWDDNDLRALKSVPGDAFEVVQTGPTITRPPKQ